MKRPLHCTVLAILALGMTFALGGCSPAGQASDSQSTEEAATASTTDRRVFPAGYLQANDNVKVVPGLESVCSVDYGIPSHTLAEQQENATVEVSGTVTELGYASRDGVPFTVISFSIDESFRGPFVTGDQITIVQPGGLISISDMVAGMNNPDDFASVPQSEWNQTYVTMMPEGVAVPDIGESYLYVLIDADEPDGLFAGAFSPLGLQDGTYAKVGEDCYSRTQAEDAPAHSSGDEGAMDTLTAEEAREYFGA